MRKNMVTMVGGLVLGDENKQEICKALAPVTFDTGNTKVANVACDSGTAMIRDIIRQIV